MTDQPTERYTLSAHGRRGVELVREAIPACGASEVLIRVRYSLVSPGTERHYVRSLAGRDESLALGYCAAGRVVACGTDIDHVAPGDAAIAMGWQLATHSSHVVMPTRLVVRIPDGLDLADAVLAPLTATAVHAADRARLTAEDRVLVVGLGPVGALLAMVATATGCAVSGWDLDRGACERAAFWQPLDAADPPATVRGSITAVFVCVDADATALLAQLRGLLAPEGTPHHRSRIINVGRLRGSIALDPAAGNFDIINASRCGAGYRDDDYHHGRKAVAVVVGEHTVDDNLRRSLAIIAGQAAALARLRRHVHSPAQALALYHAAGGFPSGLHLIDHGAP